MGVGEGKADAITCFKELCSNAVAEQEKFLLDRLTENKDTEYGKPVSYTHLTLPTKLEV